ncbi:MAG TPA: hypothetical protein VNT57_06250 [Desulfobacteria bacterium]|nr:hypothetical protein [Desulfobacteria bacterium]
MKKIKDRIILGALSGLIAGAIGRAINAVEYKAGLTDLRFNHHGASLFLPHKEAKANTIEGKIISSVVNNTMTSATGAMITYMLSITGRDYAMFKGAGVGIMQWIGIWGIFSKLRLTVKSNKPLTHILGCIDHVVFGATIGLLVSKLGDDNLFPDTQIKKGKKLPLIATNQQEHNNQQIDESNHKSRVRRHIVPVPARKRESR